MLMVLMYLVWCILCIIIDQYANGTSVHTYAHEVFLSMACSVDDHQSMMVRLVSACALGYVLDGVPCLDGSWMSPAQQMAWLFGAEWKPNIIIIIKVRV